MRSSYSLNEVAALLGMSVRGTRALADRVLEGPRDLFTFADLARMRGATRRLDPAQGVLDFRAAAPSADEAFERACRQEEAEPADAIDSYLQAVALNPMHADAHVNVGRLFHTRGRLREAEAHYVAALVARPDDSTATFNLAVVLDDLGRQDDAIGRYQDALRLDPACVDAYFNLARLYEKKGEKLAAIRHLKDYRRLRGS
jgi:tetratricopeptide (TPR) repeat protein